MVCSVRKEIQSGEMGKIQFAQGMWLRIAVLICPDFVIILSVILPQPVNFWANIIVEFFPVSQSNFRQKSVFRGLFYYNM